MFQVMRLQLGSEHPVFCPGLCLGAQTGLHYNSKTYFWGKGRWIGQQIWCESHRSGWRPGWARDWSPRLSPITEDWQIGHPSTENKIPHHPKPALGDNIHEFLLFNVQLAQSRADPGFCFKEAVDDGLSAGRKVQCIESWYHQHNNGNSGHSVRRSDWVEECKCYIQHAKFTLLKLFLYIFNGFVS